MYLSKIEICGFKSFAKKTTLILQRPAQGAPFVSKHYRDKQKNKRYQGISVIVGPNGSGKSNIADAIRWTLGEQSLKMLRGKKSEDVIFSGSEKIARLGAAESSLYFDNEDHAIDLDYPEVVFTRKVYRKGDSEYLINKKRVRLHDILILAARANFGQKNYSVIGQGMIDAVLNFSPAERKSFFDEAVGIKQYQLKRDKSIRKLENTWRNLKQVRAIVEEIEPRLRSLHRQVRRLEKRQDIATSLTKTQKNYYGVLWRQFNNKEQKLSPQLVKLREYVKKKEKELQRIQKKLNCLEKEDTRTEVFSKHQKQYQRLQEHKNDLVEKRFAINNKIELARQRTSSAQIPIPTSQIISELKEIHYQFVELSKELSDIRSIEEKVIVVKKIVTTAKKIFVLVERLERPGKQVKPVIPDPEPSKALARIDIEIKGVGREISALQQEMFTYNKQQEEKKGEFFYLQREFQKRQEEFNAFSQKLNDVKIELTKLSTRKEDLEIEIKEELASLDWLKSFKLEGQANTEYNFSEIQRLKRQLELIGGIDPETVKEHKATKERFEFLSQQSQDLNSSFRSIKSAIVELDKMIYKQFDIGFNKINQQFKKFFRTLFGGGRADLVLLKDDQLEPETEKIDQEEGTQLEIEEEKEESPEDLEMKKLFKGHGKHDVRGIEIIASPAGKKVFSINMLSGGERALTSIALICAIISSNPPPFVILDEVDAALDEANSERFGSILGDLSHRTQIIAITHNRATMHRANTLYGITMGNDGVSKLLSLKLEEAEESAKP